jgi:glyceraldehyde 3-phosphate dehydrogenase
LNRRARFNDRAIPPDRIVLSAALDLPPPDRETAPHPEVRKDPLMTVRVAINGFGRIGRLVLRSIVEHARRDIEVVAINDLGPVETNAHLLRYDSVHGRFPGVVSVEGDTLDVGLGAIKVTAIRDPAALPHKDLGVDIALECTGLFTARDKAAAHLTAGARKVLVSAPCDSADKTIVFGVNHESLTAADTVVSNGSCTTNCLAPVAKVLLDHCGIEHGYMTTIHAYTSDQPTQDTLHRDLYRARAAGLSMIPTSTGAAKALGLVLPELAGRLDGSSIRVPTANVSVVDLKIVTGREVTTGDINEAISAAAAKGPLRGVLQVTNDPLVSSDLNHVAASATVALPQTQVIGGRFARVLAWYDNEWGFSSRMSDVAVAMARIP